MRSATTNAAATIPPLSDIDVQGSSVATAPSSTGKVGSKLDVTA